MGCATCGSVPASPVVAGTFEQVVDEFDEAWVVGYVGVQLCEEVGPVETVEAVVDVGADD